MMSKRILGLAMICPCLIAETASATTTHFFSPTQVATPVASGVTSDTVSSNGYLFTYTRDKLFTGGLGGGPIGRPVRVAWPTGVEAQAVTAGPSPQKAQITLTRQDGDVFDLTAFTAKLLANTGGAGGTIEIMPSLHGEDGFNDPLYFDATGYYGNSFSYDTSPNYLGSTQLLTGFDKYTIGLYVDFAFTSLTLEGPALPPTPGDFNQDGIVDAADFTLWRDGLGDTTTAAEYNVWRTHFGNLGPVAAVANLPEPTHDWFLIPLGLGLAIHGSKTRAPRGRCVALSEASSLRA